MSELKRDRPIRPKPEDQINKIQVMNEIIVNTQTAYVKGRCITDNLRSIAFVNDFCRNENVESVLVSLDAKKAFDSVDHDYVIETLKRYGFGPKHIKMFELVYKDISARVLIKDKQITREGKKISDIEIGVEYHRSTFNLTLSNNKRGTDLGALVVPFDQTFHPLHT